MAKRIKNLPATGRPRFDPWVGKIPGEGNGYPLQYSCLEDSMDRGSWWATVHGFAVRHDLATNTFLHKCKPLKPAILMINIYFLLAFFLCMCTHTHTHTYIYKILGLYI